MSMTFIVNFASAIVMLIMGFFVLRRDRRDPQNQLFALMTIASAGWAFTSAMVDIQKNYESALFYTDLSVVAPFFFLPCLYHFCHYFVAERFKLKNVWIWILAAPALLSLPFVFTKYDAVSVRFQNWGVDFTPGPLYFVLGAYIIVILSLSCRELILKYRSVKERTYRAQVKFLFLALFLTVFSGTMTNLLLPLLGYTRAIAIGPAATLFFVVFTMYALVKHHLFDIKVIAAEVFSVLISALALLQIFDAGSLSEYALRIFTFVATTVVAVLLVRSVLQEVRQREEIQISRDNLAKTNQRLLELDKLKNTMLSVAAHQLRGPLGGIRGYLTMMRDGDLGPVNEKQHEALAMNLNVLSRLMNAVETFLDLGMLEAGKISFQTETVALDELVAGIVEEFGAPMKRKGLVLGFNCPARKPVLVHVDPNKVKHIIFNVIDNAMKYTEIGSIRVAVEVAGGKAFVKVADTGVGMSAADLAHLFRKFERGHFISDQGGSGLGLYVVKTLTEMQGGRVQAESAGVGQGTIFSVAFPLAKKP